MTGLLLIRIVAHIRGQISLGQIFVRGRQKASFAYLTGFPVQNRPVVT
jgi:hypothetical protein